MKNDITVTHVISGDLWAGAEMQAHQLCRGLKRSTGITPTAIVFNSGTLCDRLQEDGIPVTVVDEKVLSPFKMIVRMRAHLKKYNSQLIHTHGFKENVLGAAARLMAGVRHSVRTAHGNPETRAPYHRIDKHLTNGLDNLVSRFYQDAIIAVSLQLYDMLSQRFGRKVHHISNFIDIDQLRDDYLPQKNKKKSAKDSLKLGIVGRIVPVKRIDLFVDTIDLLVNKHNLNVEGWIIGDGPSRADIERRIHQKRLEKEITIKGFQSPVYPSMTELDALLMTSDHEGLPMTLIEALALEIPVIAHNVGGIPEVLDGGKAGYLVEHQEAEKYANAVVSTLQKHDFRELSQDNMSGLRTKFGVQENIKKYITLYLNILTP
ncbi:glycosyltransferase family 4 protein [Marinobacteraceae bacterium S3BR75-40.1]